MKRIISITLVVMMVAALLVACGSGPEGNYVVKSIDGKAIDEVIKEQAESLGQDADALLKQLNIEKAEDLVTLEIKSDGTVVMNVNMLSVSYDGTWKQEGDKIAITMKTSADSAEQTTEFTLKGNELSNNEGDQKYIFVKK